MNQGPANTHVRIDAREFTLRLPQPPRALSRGAQSLLLIYILIACKLHYTFLAEIPFSTTERCSRRALNMRILFER